MKITRLSKKPYLLILLFTFLGCFAGYAQNAIEWQSKDKTIASAHLAGKTIQYITFFNAQPSLNAVQNPQGIVVFKELLTADRKITLSNIEKEPASPEDIALLDTAKLPKAFTAQTLFSSNVKSKVGFNLYAKEKGTIWFLRTATIKLSNPVIAKLGLSKQNRLQANQDSTSDLSVLGQGIWVRLGTTKGMVKLDYQTLVSRCGVPTNIDPKTLKIYSHGGFMLPESNAIPRPKDIPEQTIFVKGEQDGLLNNDDFLVFFSSGTTQVFWDEQQEVFRHQVNIYADTAYYYLTWGGNAGKRVSLLPAEGLAQRVIDNHKHFAWLENEQVNFFGTGRRWFFQLFDITTTANYNFSVNNVIPNSPARLVAQTAINGKAIQGQGVVNWSFFINDSKIGEYQHFPPTDNEFGDQGSLRQNIMEFNALAGNNWNLRVNFLRQANNQLRGYLDFFTFTYPRRLSLFENETHFFVPEAKGNVSTLNISSSVDNGAQLWLRMNNESFAQVPTSFQNGILSGTIPAVNSTPELVVFNENAPLNGPISINRVNNQSLKGQPVPDLIIVAPSIFKTEVERFADFRKQKDGLDILIAYTNEIYTEFSSGKQDLIAIRDLGKHYYERNPDKFKYMLLFGACSYDYKNRVPGNTNFVPIFESWDSFSRIDSYCSDDFIGFFDANEGNFEQTIFQDLEVGIGRFSVRNLEEAKVVVDKCIDYSSPNSMGRWRNILSFVADDGDGSAHARDAEILTNAMGQSDNSFEIRKIYLGANQQIAGPGGQVSPQTNELVERAITDGSLIVNYSGHGNESLWADEEILNLDRIRAFRNRFNLPFFITATCSFGKYDNPERVSGGMLIQLTPQGGGIGLVTTNRLVFNTNNLELNREFLAAAFKKNAQGEFPRLGEVMRECKNNSYLPNAGAGNKGFGLLADPSMRLAYPMERVMIDSINSIAFTNQSNDTLRGLQPVHIKGHIQHINGTKNSGFNGDLFVSLFDKKTQLSTFDGAGSSENINFNLRNNILYNGIAKVKNGEYEVRFVIPKDIVYPYGFGRLSFYGMNQNKTIDANGATEELTIGNIFEGAPVDTTSPLMRLWLNDTTFKNGDFTQKDVTLLVRLNDENGINLSTSGIGHEMVAVIDGRRNEPFILNNFYVADAGTFQAGWVRFPINNLSVGKHTIEVTAWDTYNNSITRNLHFEVAKGNDIILNKPLVYPNPSSDEFKFILNHNQAQEALSVQLSIFDITGKQLSTQTLNYEIAPSQIGANNELKWSAKNTGVANGVYLYRLVLNNNKGSLGVQNGRLIVQP